MNAPAPPRSTRPAPTLGRINPAPLWARPAASSVTPTPPSAWTGRNDNVRIPASASLNTSSAMTIEAWIKYPSGAAAAPIVEYNTGAATGVHFWRYPNPNDLFVNYIDTTGTGHSLTGNALTPGVWHYVEPSYSGANGRLYVDGILVAISGTWSNLTLKTNMTCTSGIGRPAPATYATMDVDDVAIYNYTLPGQGGRATCTRTRADSPYATTVLADSPVAYWRLGDLTGTAAPGLMAVNPGTYTNGPTLGKTGAIATETDTAVGFDGVNDNVTISATSSLDTKTAITMEAWVNYPSSTGTGPIIEYNTGSAPKVRMWRYPDRDSLYLNLVDTSGSRICSRLRVR